MGIYIIRFRLHLIWKVFNIYICVDFDRAIIEIGFFLYIYEMFIVEWLVKIIVPGYSIITSSFLARIQTEFERNREAKNLNRKMVICYSLAMRCDWVCWILGVLQFKNFYERIVVGGSEAFFDIKCGSFVSSCGFYLWARYVGVLYIDEWWFFI